MPKSFAILFVGTLLCPEPAHAQRYTAPDGRLRIALVKQPFAPTVAASAGRLVELTGRLAAGMPD